MVLLFIYLMILFGIKCAQAQPSEFHLLELDYMGMEYRQHRNYRDAFFPQYTTISGECTESNECFKYGANALFDLNLVRYDNYRLFWRNDVNMDATNRQVRHVGWRWELGFPIIPDKLELFTRHYSRHVLDADIPDNVIPPRYPLRDEYVLKMNFYNRGEK